MNLTTKRLMAALALATAATAAWAQCTTHTIFQGGRTVICTTCCHYGNCTTTCF